jgi:hypothetical protein
MLDWIASSPVPVTPSPTASITSVATSSGLGFGATLAIVAVVAVVAFLIFVRIAAAVLPRLIQGLVVLGSMILVAGVLGSVFVLLQSIYDVIRAH